MAAGGGWWLVEVAGGGLSSASSAAAAACARTDALKCVEPLRLQALPAGREVSGHVLAQLLGVALHSPAVAAALAVGLPWEHWLSATSLADKVGGIISTN